VAFTAKLRLRRQPIVPVSAAAAHHATKRMVAIRAAHERSDCLG